MSDAIKAALRAAQDAYRESSRCADCPVTTPCCTASHEPPADLLNAAIAAFLRGLPDKLSFPDHDPSAMPWETPWGLTRDLALAVEAASDDR